MVNGRTHTYRVELTWTGNRGTGTSGYRDYGRANELAAPGKEPIAGSADRVFFGDRSRWNPEELVVAALAQCHLLSYLHVCTEHGVVVTDYTDTPTGTMAEDGAGGGAFTEVVLRPVVTVAEESMREPARQLHGPAGQRCFVAASVSFPVRHEPLVRVRQPGD